MNEILNDDRVELLSVKEVADCYGVSPNTIWVWKRKGIIPQPRKFGGCSKWSRRQIREHIILKFS